MSDLILEKLTIFLNENGLDNDTGIPDFILAENIIKHIENLGYLRESFVDFKELY